MHARSYAGKFAFLIPASQRNREHQAEANKERAALALAMERLVQEASELQRTAEPRAATIHRVLEGCRSAWREGKMKRENGSQEAGDWLDEVGRQAFEDAMDAYVKITIIGWGAAAEAEASEAG